MTDQGVSSILINMINVEVFLAWISADEAMRRLGIRPQTLYAYVSRGRLEARPDPVDPRRSLYSAEEVYRLASRRTGPRRAADIASHSIAWGEPILASALTTVARGRLYYRGRDAIRLADHATLEDAAALFWDAPYAPPARTDALPTGALKARLFAALALRAGVDPHARGRSTAALATDAASLLEALANAAAERVSADPIHQRLATAWSLDARGADLVRRALVLLLDHELNASTFSARVAASTGASLAACALAGLSTLSGPLHGASVHGVLKFIREGERLGAHAAVRARLDEGRPLPGFGHPLYPEGDPRAAALLAALDPSAPIVALCASVASENGDHPNVDFAIAALACAHGLPDDAAFAVFAIGRAIGWLGHAMEQIATGALIRPRARYIGPTPEPA